ncbi:MAG: methyltransferase domain-containing protein [Bacteroidetes bacterium]|nr:methyltransferase domain-containing protein [Bacteroidota bacterium]
MKDNSISVNYQKFWDEKYLNKENNWELNHPTQVFVDLLNSPFGLEKGKLLALGCGSGHDAILFAENGFEVTINDFSSQAISKAKKNAETKRIHIEFLQKDLFELGELFAEGFDYVLEYTTYCAINPARRTEYRDVVHKVLKNGGLFIALFFPLQNKAEHYPPFSVDVIETYNIFSENFKLKYFEKPKSSVKPRLNNEVLMIWEK